MDWNGPWMVPFQDISSDPDLCLKWPPSVAIDIISLRTLWRNVQISSPLKLTDWDQNLME